MTLQFRANQTTPVNQGSKIDNLGSPRPILGNLGLKTGNLGSTNTILARPGPKSSNLGSINPWLKIGHFETCINPKQAIVGLGAILYQFALICICLSWIALVSALQVHRKIACEIFVAILKSFFYIQIQLLEGSIFFTLKSMTNVNQIKPVLGVETCRVSHFA